MTLIKMTIWFSAILKINEIDKTKLWDQAKYRLDEIKKNRTLFSRRD